MIDEQTTRAAHATLAKRCRGRLTWAPAELATLARDFGRLVTRTPALILRPRDADDVAAALSVAAAHGLPVTTRGAGHSQNGQGLGDGLVLDMRGLDRVLGVRAAERLVEVEAGASWRRIVDATFAEGLLPLGLTHVLDTTIGGTLSVGGVGGETWRVGPQVDNVAYVDVVTMAGEIARCSADENRDLYDAVRAGLGQCGVMVRAGYPIRPCRRRIRSTFLGYRDVAAFMADVEKVCADGRAAYVSGAVVLEEAPFDRWAIVERPTSAPRLLMLVLGREHDEPDAGRELAGGPAAAGLGCDVQLFEQDTPLWNEAGLPGHLFFNVYVPPADSIDADPTTLHPWVDLMFDRDVARDALTELMGSALVDRHQNAFIFIRRGPRPAPFFMAAGGVGLSWGVGMFPSAPAALRETILGQMRRYAEHWCAAGAKKYLSGYCGRRAAADWADHYGPAWDAFRGAKLRFDPARLLNPGFLDWGGG